MAYEGLITKFLGQGLAADRPAAPNLHPDAIGLYWATDTTELSVWASGAWVENVNHTGSSALTDGDKGDITVASSGASWTIDNGAVTLAKMADLVATTIVGNNTALPGVPKALTPAEVTAMLAIFDAGQKGLVPASGGGTSNFLRADGTWAVPTEADGDKGDIIISAGVWGLDPDAVANKVQRVADRAEMAGLDTDIAAYFDSDIWIFNSSNLTTMVASDPAAGIHVPPTSDVTGASGAWVRQTDHLTCEMFGATGLVDDTDAMRRCFTMASLLKLPVRGKGPVVQLGLIRFGSLTTTAPAAGTADYVRIEGLRIRMAAGVASGDIIYFNAPKGVVIEDVEFDIETSATTGVGGFRFDGGEDCRIANVRKIRSTPLGAASGGSVVSLRQDCRNFTVDGVRVENAGDSSSAVFCIGVYDSEIRNATCVAGQEVVDLSGCSNTHLVNIRGEDVDEILDVGNSVGCTATNVSGTCATGVLIKTEVSGSFDAGTTDFILNGFDIEATQFGVGFSAGATATQLLHRNKFLNGRIRMAAGTSASRAFRFVAGDNAADPAKGTVVDNVIIDMNAGFAFDMLDMVEYRISNVTSNVPVRTSVQDYTTDRKAVWESITATGDFSTDERGTTYRNIKLNGGKFLPTNGIGNRYHDIELRNATGDAFDIIFNNATTGVANKDVVVDGLTVIDSSTSGAGSYSLRVRHTATSGPIENVHIRNVVIEDTGGATTGGCQFANATFDWCSLSNVQGRGIVTHADHFFLGLNSKFENVHLRSDFEVRSGGSFTINKNFWGRHADWTNAAGQTLTLPTAAATTTAWPAGTAARVTHSGGGAAFTIAGSGTIIVGPTSVPSGKTVTIRQTGTASRYFVELSA